MKVLILGAGVVGVACAYYLQRAGHEVTVVDRQPGAGLETSFANGGQISANHATPWANPAAPLKLLRWLGREDSPLLFRPRMDPDQWRWGIRFLLNCTAARARLNTGLGLRIALYSRRCLGQLRRETGIEYHQLLRGILHVYRDPHEYKTAVPQARRMSDLGCRRDVVSVEQCLALEPALAAAADRLVGGIFSPDDESGDAHVFTRELAARLAGQGVEFRYQVTVTAIRVVGDRVVAVDTDAGPLVADAYVVALASHGPRLLGPLGLRLPIYPAKGYSVSIPIDGHQGAPTVSLIDDEYKMVYSRLGSVLRVAGTAEFTGFDTGLTPSRCRPLLERAMALFPDCGASDRAEYWTGLRPMTPDSIPVLGRAPQANLYLNTGHGTLGWTMACGSGRAVADLVSGQTPEIDLSGLGWERFR